MLGEEFQLPLDEGGYSPRECARCGGEFRIRWGRRDARSLAAALSARLDHLNPLEAGAEGPVRHCPYCAAAAAAHSWWTPDLRRWFETSVEDLARELRWLRMRMPLDTLSDNPRPTYVALPPPRASSAIAMPDDAGLVSVPLPCCGEDVKISDRWIGPVWCHFCGYVHARSATRDAWLELAQLRNWSALP